MDYEECGFVLRHHSRLLIVHGKLLFDTFHPYHLTGALNLINTCLLITDRDVLVVRGNSALIRSFEEPTFDSDELVRR